MSALDDLLRYRFLESVHDTTDGDRFRPTNVAEVAAVVGLSKEAAEGIAQFLVDEGLLKWHSGAGPVPLVPRDPRLPAWGCPGARPLSRAGARRRAGSRWWPAPRS